MEKKVWKWESGKKELTELDNNLGVREEERIDKDSIRFSSAGHFGEGGYYSEKAMRKSGVWLLCSCHSGQSGRLDLPFLLPPFNCQGSGLP